jgi:hypothetical protein
MKNQGRSSNAMRLVVLAFTAILVTATATAGQATTTPAGDGKASSQATGTTGGKGNNDDPSSSNPVSLDKVRTGLENTPPEPAIRGLSEEAVHFQVQVQERQKIVDLLSTLDFKNGPKGAIYPGGRTQYDIDRLVNDPIEHPLAQPYAAFSTSELITIAVENLTGKYLGGRIVDAVSSAERARAERAAREDVARSMAEFCAGQPNQGAGLQSCALTASDR